MLYLGSDWNVLLTLVITVIAACVRISNDTPHHAIHDIHTLLMKLVKGCKACTVINDWYRIHHHQVY